MLFEIITAVSRLLEKEMHYEKKRNDHTWLMVKPGEE